MTELVVLLDAAGQAVGTADKATVHGAATPRHLAFSAYLLDARGRLLVTRRAATKATFPGVWTNSVCGHPGPGEPLDAAVARRARSELGLEVTDLRLVLPEFAYVAEMDGVVEDEWCPVLVGHVVGSEATPDPDEVDGLAWVPWGEFAEGVLDRSRPVSAWCREQVAHLVRLGDDPARWPEGDVSLLPPAATFEPT